MNWHLKIPGLKLDRWAPQRTWSELLERWRSEGIRSLIFPVQLRSEEAQGKLLEIREAVEKTGLQFWLTLSVFNQPWFYREHAAMRAVPRSGMDLPSWFGPICPTSEVFRLDFSKEFLSLLENLHPHTVLLDHFRVPYAWEEWGVEIRAGAWPVFCYCTRCTARFEHETDRSVGEVAPEDWIRWQQEILAGFLQELWALAQTVSPKPAIGVQVPPFVSPTRWRLRHNWAGLNLAILKKTVDFFSPLLYSGLLGWTDDELLAYLIEFSTETKVAVLPGLQVVPTRWDRAASPPAPSEESLIDRMAPLGIRGVTLFHAAAFVA